jgi:sensor histidine kinase YesM
MKTEVKNCQFDFLRTPQSWLQLIAINLLIAIVLSIVDFNFWVNFTYSQSIGISVASLITITTNFYRKSEPTFVIYITTIPLGSIIGLIIASLILKVEFLTMFNEVFFKAFMLAITFSILVSIYFITNFHKRQKQAELKNKLQSAQIKLLQAQIEPHFLFNTLANITSLIDEKPASAKQLLNDIILYLRKILNKSRNKKNIKIIDEIELIKLYLKIQQQRLKNRLEYKIKITKNCEHLEIPPLLLQPLVENAVIHGIEPVINGGTINVDFFLKNNQLNIKIIDSGKGFKLKNIKGSYAIKNIHNRIDALFDKKASIKIYNNKPTGTIVELLLPAFSTKI